MEIIDIQKKKKRASKKHTVMHERRGGNHITNEHKKWILERLACHWPQYLIAEAFELEFDRPCVKQQTLSQYAKCYAGEIEKMREHLRDNLVESSIVFAAKHERVAEYSRQAVDARKNSRAKEVRECLYSIAEEMGDLKTKHEHSGEIKVDNISAEQRIDRLAELAAEIESSAAKSNT